MFPGDAASVTPNDNTNFTENSVIYTGTGGQIRVMTAQGTVLTFANVQPGTVLPVQVRRVYSSITDATGIIRIF
jgi:hypothetical protein